MDSHSMEQLTKLLADAADVVSHAYDQIRTARDRAGKVPHNTPAEVAMWRLTCATLSSSETKLQAAFQELWT